MAWDQPSTRSEPDLPFIGGIAFAFGGLILIFTGALLAVATLAQWAGSPPWIFSVPVAALITATAAVIWARRLHTRRVVFAAAALLAACGLTIVISAVSGARILDTSFDGQWYHQEALIRLTEGWNPPRADLEPADYGDDRARRQLNGYPKASWLWGSALVRAGHGIEYAKALSLPLMVAAATVAFAALFGLGRIPWWVALGTAAATAANPVAITQTLNTQLDGDLFSMMVIAAASLIVWARTTGRRGALTLSLAIVIGVNLKLTAPAYFAILMAGGLLAVALTGGARTSLRRAAVVMTGAYLFGVAIVGFHPYVTNTVRHGHPFYPVMGPEKALLIPLAETNRVTLLLRSVFSPSRQFPQHADADRELMDTPLKLPFSATPSEIRVFVMPDVRGGGLGPFFGGLCLLAAAALAAAGLVGPRWLVMGGAMALPILASVLIMPHPWFARFVPQLWLLPLVLIPLAWTAGGRLSRGLSTAALVAALANVSLVAVGYFPATVRHSALIEQRLEALHLFEQPLMLNLRPFPSNRARLGEMGVRFTRVRDPRYMLQLVLGRHQPEPPETVVEADDGLVDLQWAEAPHATHYRIKTLLPAPTGPGGGALSVAQRSSHEGSITVPVGNGELRILFSSCNLLGCGPPMVSEPMTITGVRRRAPLIGHPEDGTTVFGRLAQLSWLGVDDPELESSPSYGYEVVDPTNGETVASGFTDGISATLHLPPGREWIARVHVIDTEPPRQSQPVRFRTARAVDPMVITPDSGSIVMEGEVDLSWSDAIGACGYEYLVTVPGDRHPADRGTTSTTSHRIGLTAKGDSPTTYHAIVRSRVCTGLPWRPEVWGPWNSETGFGPAVFTVIPAASPEDPPR